LKIKVDKSITFTLKSLHSFRRFSPTFTDVFYRLYSTKTMSAAKRAKLESEMSAAKNAKLESPTSDDASLKSMVDEIEKSRSDSAKDVSKCNFNKKRVRLLAGNEGNCCLRRYFRWRIIIIQESVITSNETKTYLVENSKKSLCQNYSENDLLQISKILS
jgi:hypothetical protein